MCRLCNTGVWLEIYFEMIGFQVKVLAIDDKLNTVYEDGIKFDTDLPEFK